MMSVDIVDYYHLLGLLPDSAETDHMLWVFTEVDVDTAGDPIGGGHAHLSTSGSYIGHRSPAGVLFSSEQAEADIRCRVEYLWATPGPRRQMPPPFRDYCHAKSSPGLAS